MMRALWAEFPETPPYEGAFDDPAPHATLGRVPEGTAPEEFVGQLNERLDGLLPNRCNARDVSLLEEFEPDRWRERMAFPLGIAE